MESLFILSEMWKILLHNLLMDVEGRVEGSCYVLLVPDV